MDGSCEYINAIQIHRFIRCAIKWTTTFFINSNNNVNVIDHSWENRILKNNHDTVINNGDRFCTDTNHQFFMFELSFRAIR